MFTNVDKLAPVCWLAFVNISNKYQVFSNGSQLSCNSLETHLIACCTSCPVILAKSKKSFVKYSSSCQVAPNLVFISQIAFHTTSILSGTFLNTLLALSVNQFNKSQLAQVNLIISLLAWSTWLAKFITDLAINIQANTQANLIACAFSFSYQSFNPHNNPHCSFIVLFVSLNLACNLLNALSQVFL